MITEDPKFETSFSKFARTGDELSIAIDGYVVKATIHVDESPLTPEESCEGFWPSLEPTNPGYIGAGKTQADLDRATATARHILETWEKGEWFYGGLMFSVWLEDVCIDDHAASIWNIEVNYPDSDNSELTAAANEYLFDALTEARASHKALVWKLIRHPVIDLAELTGEG